MLREAQRWCSGDRSPAYTFLMGLSDPKTTQRTILEEQGTLFKTPSQMHKEKDSGTMAHPSMGLRVYTWAQPHLEVRAY